MKQEISPTSQRHSKKEKRKKYIFKIQYKFVQKLKTVKLLKSSFLNVYKAALFCWGESIWAGQFDLCCVY